MTEIAYRQEIETGPATVRMCVDNTVEEYEAEITEIDLGSENTNKNFVLEITDQRLLQKTGGIVQGNSGSPVLQNRKADRRHYPCFRKPSRKRLRCLCGKHA